MNYPDGDKTQLMYNAYGWPDDLNRRATGAVIEVVVDHSDGSLAFGVNGAPPRRVPEGWPPDYDFYEHHDDETNEPFDEGHVPPAKVPFKFPQGAQLRPWASLHFENDRVSFTRGYL